jgi:Holliday junction resolvasome RuvABC endonuclease subunit
MIIGIDFSINSTAVAIKTEKGISLFSFVPNYSKGKKAFAVHESLEGIVAVQSYLKPPKAKDSIEEQSNKLINADQLSGIIMSILEAYDEPVTEIRIEGFSYGSKGNSFIDLITYNTYLKVKLIQKFGHVIKVIPPKTLKKAYTGNGNASKCDMLRAFMEKSSTPLSTKIESMDILKEGEFTIPKPLDDLVDAVGLVSIMNEN